MKDILEKKLINIKKKIFYTIGIFFLCIAASVIIANKYGVRYSLVGGLKRQKSPHTYSIQDHANRIVVVKNIIMTCANRYGIYNVFIYSSNIVKRNLYLPGNVSVANHLVTVSASAANISYISFFLDRLSEAIFPYGEIEIYQVDNRIPYIYQSNRDNVSLNMTISILSLVKDDV